MTFHIGHFQNDFSFEDSITFQLEVILRDSVSQVLNRNSSYDSPMTFQLKVILRLFFSSVK
jgi:hypothetical protein